MTESKSYALMKEKLEGIVPDFELRHKATIADEILIWKEKRNAVILAHNYMEPALFHSGIADYKGDSLKLSRDAAETDADVIVFCGVRFMAETAYILNPTKTVLLPAKVAGCSLAAGITAEDVRNLKKRFPGIPVVTYINTYADVKAECDICCTSGNSHKVMESMGSDKVIFLPDHYLAENVAKETGKNIIFPTRTETAEDYKDVDYQVIGWDAKCEVHDQFTVEDVTNARKQFPGLAVITHPESPPEVVEVSDYSGSTSVMNDWVKNSDAKQFLVLTECSMADNIAAENKDKEMIGLCSVRCPHMNEITLEDTLNSLKNMERVIKVDEEIRLKALKSVQAMLDIGR